MRNFEFWTIYHSFVLCALLIRHPSNEISGYASPAPDDKQYGLELSADLDYCARF